jgi:HemY protein
MIRLFLFLALVLAAALGLAWLADRPGEVMIVWQGAQYKMTMMTALGLMAALLVGLVLCWSVLSSIFRLPGLVSSINRMRRRAKGMSAVSRGIVAIGAGDLKRAERQSKEAERLLGHEPLTLLLKAQAAQLGGDRANAEAAFRKMLDDPETKILGLRGLFVEARRRSDSAAARLYAEEAFRAAPGVPWAGDAVLEHRSAEKDWRGAMEMVEQQASRKLIDKAAARRMRAVLLAAEADGLIDRSPDEAQRAAAEANKLEPGLVPSAVILGQRLSAKGDYKGASRVLENAWRLSPHPAIAEAYLDVRPGDSADDRLKRARLLQKAQPRERESRFAVARAAMDAQDFSAAREELEALIIDKPTVRACQLLAELEMLDGQRAGPSREWLSRASRAPRDPAWVADGFVSERWMPVSPITGRLDAFVWQEPAQAIEASLRAELDADKIIADHDEAPLRKLPPDHAATSGHAEVEILALPSPREERALPVSEEPKANEPPGDQAGGMSKAKPEKNRPAFFATNHLPDDPGVER